MKNIWLFISKHYPIIYKGVLFLISLVVLVSFFPKEAQFKYEYNRGRPWMHEDLIAPFDFAVLKPAEEIEQERNEITENKELYFDFDLQVNEMQRAAFRERFENTWRIKYPEGFDDTLKQRTLAAGLDILTQIHSRGVLQSIPELDNKPSDYSINLIIQNVAERVRIGDLYTVQEAYDAMKGMLDETENIDEALLGLLLEEFISQNVFFNGRVTNAELRQQLDRISTTRGMVQEGERIISKGEVVTATRYQLLESLRTEYQTRIGVHSNYYLILAGQVILVTLSLLVLALFLYAFRREVLYDNKKVVLILLTICMCF